MAAYSLKHEKFPFHYKNALSSSALIPKDVVNPSADGTCSHASPYDRKVCKCLKIGISHCSCRRYFSDPNADWGWDNDKEVFFFGRTLYMLCTHNADAGVDLPLHIRFLNAKRHNSLSTIVSLTNLSLSTRISPSGTSVWIPPMTTMPLTSLAKNGTFVFLSISIRTAVGRSPFRIPSPLTKTALRCAWANSAWSTR